MLIPDVLITGTGEVNVADAAERPDARYQVSQYLDPLAKASIVALGLSLEDAGLSEEAVLRDPYGYGIVFGAIRGSVATRKKLYEAFEKEGRRLLSGVLFSHCGHDMAAAMTAIAYGIRGPNLTICKSKNLRETLLRRCASLDRKSVV